MSIDLSIIIPTFNKHHRLSLTLKSLEMQDIGSEWFEVIVIDDCSSDYTQLLLSTYNPPYELRVITNKKNCGQAICRNKGISVALGRVIVFIDDDLICSPRFLSLHRQQHTNTDSLIVLGRINRINNEDFPKIWELAIQNYDALHDYLTTIVRKDIYLDMVETVFKWQLKNIVWICFTGGNSSMSRSLLDAAGYFDEKFYKWGPEDIELGYRLFINGGVFHYEETIVNFHLDSVKERNKMLIQTAKNLKHLKEKYKLNSLIKDYINFTSGGVSIQDFAMRAGGNLSEIAKAKDPFCFTPFDYINLKSKTE